MNRRGLQADQLYTWSDTHASQTASTLFCRRFASTTPTASASVTPARPSVAGFPHRALQTLRQAGMQMRPRPRSWPQVLPRWQGGACTHHSVPLPPSIADRMRYPAPLVDRVRNLAQSLPDAQIVDRLNQEGLVSALGKPFTLSMIRWIRHRYKIPAAKLMSSDELTVQQVAERFRVSIYVVYPLTLSHLVAQPESHLRLPVP